MTTLNKNRTDLRSNTPAPVRREVHATINPPDYSDRSRNVLQALGRLTEFAKDRQAKKDDEAYQRGIRDQSLGQVSKDDDNEWYLAGVRKQETYARGLEWFNGAVQDLPTQFRDDPDFNYEEWKREKVAEYLSHAETPEEVKAANGQVQRFLESMDASAARIRSDILVQRGADALASTALQGLHAGAFRTAKDFEALVTQGEELVGIGRDDAIGIIAPYFLDAISSGELELADSVRDVLQNHAGFGHKLIDAEEHGKAAIARRQEEERREALRTNYALYDDLNRRVESKALTTAYLSTLIESKVLSAEEAAGYMSRQRQKIEAEAEALRKEAEKEQRNIDLQRLIGSGQLNLSVGKDRTDAIKLLDTSYSTAAMMHARAQQSGDKEAEAQALQALGQSLVLAKVNGYMPKPLKQQLDAIDYGNGEAALPILAQYRHLNENGYADFFRVHLSSKTLARLDAFNTSLRGSGDAKQAVTALSSRTGITPEQRAQAMRYIYGPLAKKAESLAGSDADAFRVQQELLGYTQGYIDAGYLPDAAMDKAVEQFEENSERIGQHTYRRGEVPEDFDSMSADYIESVVKPWAVKSRYVEKDAAISMYPVQGRPGQFQLLVNGREVLFDEEGQPATVDIPRMTAQLTKLNAERARKREEDFKTLRDQRLFNPGMK